MPAPTPEVSVGLSIFGSLVTEMAAPDLPEGVSPDNQDVVYYPGGVQSRPALTRLYATGALPANVTITYLKTYVQPNSVPLNILVDSDGNVWSENVTVAPGVLTKIGAVTPGSYCSSATAFGREYLAFHDGIQGSDIPRQFDGSFFDRVSQDGPGSPPAVSDLLLSSIGITSLTPRAALTIVSVIQTGTLITVTTAPAHGLFVNDQVLVNTANSIIDNRGQPILVQQVASATSFSYEVGVTGAPAQSSGTVTSLAITLKTSAAHGLLTDDSFVIDGTGTPYDNNVNEVVNGTATLIAQISQVSNSTIALVVTTVAHGLQSGDTITTDVGNAQYDQLGTLFPIIVTSPTTLSYDTGYSGLPTLTAGVGGAPFTVTQRINLNSPPNWIVRTVIDATTLTFTGVSASGGTVHAGTFQGGGISAEGSHLCVVMFQTRQGYITAPSTPISFSSSGGRRFSISNLPIGPPNVVARILAFTGSGGGNFFYIPVTPLGTDVSGKQVAIGTSTVINDNTTSTAILDIADNTLFDSTAIDIPGNNLFELAVLGPSIGCIGYAGRMAWWGENNRILNLVNMGFNGGYLAATRFLPLGWNTSGVRAGTGALATITGAPDFPGFGMAWQIDGDGLPNGQGLISQPAFQDYYSVPILEPSKQYTFRCWAQPGIPGMTGQLFCDFFSPTLGILSVAAIGLPSIPLAGGFVTAAFNQMTPDVIPPDLELRLYAEGLTPVGIQLLINEMEIIPSDDPFTSQLAVSYVANPESFDAETGLIANQDPTQIQVSFLRYDTLHFLSSQALYRTNDSSSGEPDSWTVVQVSGRCGAAGPRACDVGENIAFWVSSPTVSPPTGRGLYVYYGGQVAKVSQEIQPDFDSVNPAAQSSIWLVNDMISRRVYIGLPIAEAAAPSLIYPLDYREMDVASDIATRPPIHISFSGKMICSDQCRKWTRWKIAANCGAMYMLPNGVAQFVIGGGNGQAPGEAPGFANAYWLNPARYTDDDYGQIVPYYVTYFFVNHEAEMALGVGLQRKLFKRFSAFLSGIGNFLLTPFADALSNPYPSPPLRPLSLNPTSDIADGLNVSAERVAFKLQSVPLTGETDNAFNLQKFIPTLKKEPVSPIRGGAV